MLIDVPISDEELEHFREKFCNVSRDFTMSAYVASQLVAKIDELKKENERLLDEFLICDKSFHKLAGDSEALESGLNLRQALDKIETLQAENARMKALKETEIEKVKK